MAYKDKIKQYAKKLYLQINENGEQVETFRTIALKVTEKCTKKSTEQKKNVPHKTILEWCHQGGWERELNIIKADYARRVEEARKAEEERAITERAEILGKGATTLELGRLKNEAMFREVTTIIQAKLQFNKMILSGKKPDEYTWDQVYQRALSDTQLVAVFKTLSDKQFNYDQIIAEASKYADNKLEITYNVIEGGKPNDQNNDSIISPTDEPAVDAVGRPLQS